jgi:hypothetical protein
MSESHSVNFDAAGNGQSQRAEPKTKGKATGERIPGYKYQLIVEAAGREEPVARIARQVGVDRATATAIIQRESRTIQQRKQELLDQSLRIARRAANIIESKIDDKARLAELVPVYGCAVDKIAALSPPPDLAISQHLHYYLEPNDVTSKFNNFLHALQEKVRALPPPQEKVVDTKQPESPEA